MMHGIESGIGPTRVPSFAAEQEAEFDWDRPMPLQRAHCDLRFLKDSEAMDRVRPTWLSWSAAVALVPSSLYGAFLAGELQGRNVLVITFDASVHGCRAILRTNADPSGVTR